ncbi:MAG: hypothetical protein ACRD4L_15140, partial [Pyrinomonadaceae bacterium]
ANDYISQLNEERILKFLALLLMVFAHVSTSVEARQDNPAHKTQLIIIRGRVVCLNETGRSSSIARNTTASNTTVSDTFLPCSNPPSRFGLVDNDTKLYTFSPSDAGTAMFTDSRVRARELQVTARLGENNQLEVIRVQSLQTGKLYDIYYFCEICNIKAYAPGICPCCGKELELEETPVP